LKNQILDLKERQEQEKEHLNKMKLELERKHIEEEDEIKLFCNQQKMTHERESIELHELMNKQNLKISSEEMYGKIMTQKQKWKKHDTDMRAWSLRKLTKSENR